MLLSLARVGVEADPRVGRGGEVHAVAIAISVVLLLSLEAAVAASTAGMATPAVVTGGRARAVQGDWCWRRKCVAELRLVEKKERTVSARELAW